jgi:hypothetical protein
MTAARHMSTANSIVQRLTRREHSGSNLGVLLHQHYGYRMHYTCNRAFGNRSFERRFRSYDSVLDFWTSVIAGTPEGLCACITGREEFFDVDPGTLIDIV